MALTGGVLAQRTAVTYLEVSIIFGTREPRVVLCKLLSPETNL